MLISEVIKSPILTEKTYALMETGVYTFKVSPKTNKIEIAKAVEFIFQVKVDRVNLIKVPKKAKKVGRFSGFTSQYKKAYVFLAEGYTINFFPQEAVETKEKVKETKEAKADVVSKEVAQAAEAKAAAKIAAKKASKEATKIAAPKKTEAKTSANVKTSTAKSATKTANQSGKK